MSQSQQTFSSSSCRCHCWLGLHTHVRTFASSLVNFQLYVLNISPPKSCLRAACPVCTNATFARSFRCLTVARLFFCLFQVTLNGRVRRRRTLKKKRRREEEGVLDRRHQLPRLPTPRRPTLAASQSWTNWTLTHTHKSFIITTTSAWFSFFFLLNIFSILPANVVSSVGGGGGISPGGWRADDRARTGAQRRKEATDAVSFLFLWI